MTAVESGALARGHEIYEASQRALSVLPSLAEFLLPDGRREGFEWVARNPARDDRHAGSFKVNIANGRWLDWACPEVKGPDPLSLFAHVKGCVDLFEAATRLNELLSTTPLPAAAPLGARPDWTAIVPAPSEAGTLSLEDAARLAPAGFVPKTGYPYEDAAGRLLCYALRFEKPDGSGKTMRPVTWCENAHGVGAWRTKAAPFPGVLYNLGN